VSGTAEVLLLLALLVAMAFLVAKLLRTRLSVRQDELHLGRLLGRSVPSDAPPEEETPGRLRQSLLAAGFEIPPAVAVAAVLLLAILVALAMMLLWPALLWAAPLAAAMVVWLVASTVTEAARLRAWRFENRLVDAIDLTIGALSAGQNPAEALASGAEGALDPVRGELRELADQLRASVPIDRAAGRMLLRYPSDGVRIFTQLLIAKADVGGPLAPALQAVTRTMRDSLRLRGQLQTHVAGAQGAAIVVATLPYLLVAVFLWKRPEALALVWAFPWGRQLFALAIVLQVAGFVWLRRILRTEL
jgi:tight adherence protein B